MIVTKAPEPSFAFPREHPIEGLPEPVGELTAEQKLALAEAHERDRKRQEEWSSIIQALEDNSMAVFRGHAPVPQRGRAGAGQACPDEF